MNFIKRAFKNVTRKWSKSVLLLITFFVIGNFVIIGLGVSNAASSAKTLTRQKMRAVATLGVDYDAVNEYVNSLTDEDEIDEFYRNYPTVKVEDVKELLKDERVKTANATTFSTLYPAQDTNLDFVHLGNRAEESITTQSCYFEGNEEVCNESLQSTFGLKTNLFPDMIEFQDGEFKVVEGRFYSQEDIDNYAQVALVSQAFADLNNLHVGDQITFAMDDWKYYSEYSDGIMTPEDCEVTFEIIGIYTHNRQITPDTEGFDYTYPYENYDNVILTSLNAYFASSLPMAQKRFDMYAAQYPDDEYYSDPANRPDMDDFNMMGSDTTILLNDPLEVDDFVNDYKDGLRQFLKLDANNQEFDRLAKPLDTLSLYANFIIWLVIINAIVIITLVTALTLKTREYEIGVLLSIGASKVKIVAQFFVELALVAVLGFTMAIASGSLIADKIGQTVLSYQIESSGVNEQNKNDYVVFGYTSVWDDDYTSDVYMEDFVSEYHVDISPLIIGEIYVVGLGIVLVAILIPSMMIMRFNPKKILMNQN